jgi:hypothetical protein
MSPARLQLFAKRMKRRMTGMTEVCINPLLHLSILTSDQGIRKTTEWYNSHLQVTRPQFRGQAPPKIPTVVLLTEDVANRQKAEGSGITAISSEGVSLTRLGLLLIHLQ